MIPLLFLALFGAVGFAAYEFIPKAHTYVDDHVKAIRDAIAAHQVADAHLEQVQTTLNVHAATQDARAMQVEDPGIAMLRYAQEHLDAAIKANKLAAASTIPALKTAKTDQQMTTATQSAVAVDVRQKQLAAIAAELAQLGAGQCGARTYHVTEQLKDVLLAKLDAKGMTVTQTGEMKWDVDTGQHGVKLRAVWDPQSQILKLIVTEGVITERSWSHPFLIECDDIWGTIDPVMKEILGA